jgi:uncharacterized protein YprB with RNaseH-like and TPR domain
MFWDEDDIFEDLGQKFWEQANSAQTETSSWAEPSTVEEQLGASELLEQLLEKHRDKDLTQVFNARLVENLYGQVYLIQSRYPMKLYLLDWPKAKEILLHDLTLVFGIREVRQQQLHAQGYHTLYDLAQHPYFAEYAREVLALIEDFDAARFLDFLYRRNGAWSTLQALYSSAYFNPEDFLFFDLETLGLFHRLIILVGLAYIREDNLIIEQYVVAWPEQEPAALHAFLQRVANAKALVSFNGRAFDFNYILERLAYNDMPNLPALPHYDLFHLSKKIFQGQLADFKLKSLEKQLFGIERQNDIPSDLVPNFYYVYQQTGNIGPLVPIITHNQQDLISLALLLSKLHKELAHD